MKIGLKNIHRSLTGQLGLLTTVFVILAIILINASFIQSIEEDDDSLRFTYHRAAIELLQGVLSDDHSLEDVEKSEVLNKIAAENSEFRYFAIFPQGTLSFGGRPDSPKFPEKVYDAGLKGQKPASISNIVKANAECDFSEQGERPFTENGLQGLAYYSLCPEKHYYLEIVGITTPAFSKVDRVGFILGLLSEGAYRYYLVIGLGVFLIAMLIIFRMISSMTEISRTTSRMNLGSLDVGIEEEKLPLEIQPMARSLNDMVRRIEESSERQGLFLAAAAHELRTPMTILRIRIEELKDSETKQGILKDLQRLNILVDQLLNLTKLKSLDEIELTDIDILSVVREICAGRARYAVDCGVELELVSETADIRIKGQRSMIETAVTNVIDNAIRHSKRNDVVAVKVTNEGYVLVEDQGEGIPEDEAINIFEPFAKDPQNRKGYGLGLAIVSEIVKLHSGAVSARNLPNAGAVFSLNFGLPLASKT